MAVCVSRLQYCQYSQKKISLITLLSDLVQDATLYSLFHLKTVLHVSGGTTTHHQERKQLYLQLLVFATPLLLPAAIQLFQMQFQLLHDSGR